MFQNVHVLCHLLYAILNTTDTRYLNQHLWMICGWYTTSVFFTDILTGSSGLLSKQTFPRPTTGQYIMVEVREEGGGEGEGWRCPVSPVPSTCRPSSWETDHCPSPAMYHILKQLLLKFQTIVSSKKTDLRHVSLW